MKSERGADQGESWVLPFVAIDLLVLSLKNLMFSLRPAEIEFSRG